MRPIGPDIPNSLSVILQSMQDAITALQRPGSPQLMAHVALKTDLPAASLYPECGVICDEINSLVVSTLVTGAYAWKRADGSAV